MAKYQKGFIVLKKFLIIFTFTIALFSNQIDISKNEKISILQNSYIYITSKNEPLNKIKNKFEPFNKEHLNLGATQNEVWIKFTLKNPTNKDITKALIFSSPLLEEIFLYHNNNIQKEGIFHSKNHNTISYFYTITINKNSSKTFFVKTKIRYTVFDFSLYLQDLNSFLQNDLKQQAVNILLIGFIIALMIYAFVLGFYIKDKSYLFYGIYLFALIFHQITYLGLTQIYLPKWFIEFDIKITIIKISILIITSALFAIYFLHSKNIPALDRGYKIIIFISFLELLFLTPTTSYHLYINIVTGMVFIIYNLFAAIYIYNKGYTQARLFIVGFSIVFISYTLIIVDALGLISIMIYFRNILSYATAFEALVLSLAFADRYQILQIQKQELDKKMVNELKNREKIIKNEVILKTQKLNDALKEKEMLLKEIHHRVKNNLQIILSMIRLQKNSSQNCDLEILKKLENRINAIAKTYNSLLTKDSFKNIDMNNYLNSLIKDIVSVLGNPKDIKISLEASINLPFKKAVYLGIIVNELVTNSFKHAFKNSNGKIDIKLYNKNNQNILEVQDNGIGFDSNIHKNSLGLKLINIIVKNQLNGKIVLNSTNKTQCIIRF
jgi:two-component sensor histidine kinase